MRNLSTSACTRTVTLIGVGSGATVGTGVAVTATAVGTLVTETAAGAEFVEFAVDAAWIGVEGAAAGAEAGAIAVDTASVAGFGPTFVSAEALRAALALAFAAGVDAGAELRSRKTVASTESETITAQMAINTPILLKGLGCGAALLAVPGAEGGGDPGGVFAGGVVIGGLVR